MNRFQLVLLTSLLLGGRAWGQPATGTAPPRPSPPPPIPIEESVNEPPAFVPPMPAPVNPHYPANPVNPATPIPDANDYDSCGCGGGCCNLAHPWRQGNALGGNSSCETCNICDGGGVCGPPGRFWVDVDYLFWRVGGDRLPALVTTSPSSPLTPVAAAGVLPATVLLGNQIFNGDPRSGARINMGTWLNASQTFGIQVGGFMLQDQAETVTLSSAGNPILARPFLNLQTGSATQASQLIAYPDVVAGNISVRERNTFEGLDLALRGNVCCGDAWRFDALIGYRYLRFTEQLLIQEHLVAGPNAPTNIGIPAGTNVGAFDRFDAGNAFHAAQVGFNGELRLWEKISLGGTAKASFGVVNQGVGIDGATRFSTDNASRVGGLLALNSNIGAYHRSDTALVPELNLNLGYQVTSNVRLRVGYDFIYIPSVQRAGAVVDLGIDPRRIPPIANPTVNRPAFDNAPADLFIQGVHANLEFRF